MATVSISDQLKALVELQKLDGEIYRLCREVEAAPTQAARLKEEHGRSAQGLQAAEAKYKALEVKRNEMENDLGQKEQQIKKLQTQLFQLKTNKEYSAMQKEIEGLKADRSVLEEQILLVMEEVDRVKGQLSAERGELKAKEAQLAEQLQGLEGRAAGARESMERLGTERAALTPKVDPNILSQYERILERKEGQALVPVRGNACGGCNMVLPPQMLNEVLMGSRLVPCESCARILYVEPTS